MCAKLRYEFYANKIMDVSFFAPECRQGKRRQHTGCLTMFEDALETSGGGLNVFDVYELVLMGI
jgi:hypothetical protein